MSRLTSRGEASVGQLRGAFSLSRQAMSAAAQRRALPPKPPARRRPAETWLSDDEALTLIREVVTANPGWGTPKVWAFIRHVRNQPLGRRRVWRLMREAGLLLPAPHREPREQLRGHVAVADSNRRWATDLTTAVTAHDGVVAVMPVIDCGDRVLLDIEVSKAQDAPSVLLPVERALFRTYGTSAAVPDGLELLTDHGPQYTGNDCDALCTAWGVEHRFSAVGRPTGNAIAERVILTIKSELIWTRDWKSLSELREAVRDWMVHYNEQRPHEALDWQTPAQRRSRNTNPAHADAA